MSDEQGMREAFEKWIEAEGRYRGHRLNVGHVKASRVSRVSRVLSRHRGHRLNVGHGWDAAWQARDAEVQALKAALTTAQDALLKVGHRLAKVHEDADGAEIALDAHYATQKTEGKAADAD